MGPLGIVLRGRFLFVTGFKTLPPMLGWNILNVVSDVIIEYLMTYEALNLQDILPVPSFV